MHALVTFILYRNYAALGNFFSLMPTLTTFLKPKSKTLPLSFVLLFWFGTAVARVAAAYSMAARKNRAREGERVLSVSVTRPVLSHTYNFQVPAAQARKATKLFTF